MSAPQPALVDVVSLPRVRLDPSLEQLRGEVREFLAQELEAGSFEPACDAWLRGHSPEFSRKLGARGWIGLTWPTRYGGLGRSNLEKYVVTEELLAAGAPVAAHWGVDRQIGPSLLRFGSEQQRERFLPLFARGECFVAGAMSEPDSGSDLASIRTEATPVDGGWLLNGRKVWTSHAHRSHFVVVLCRTEPRGENRHVGISQLIVDLDAPGLEVRPIRVLTGEQHFNEVTFDDVFVPDDMILGNPGDGWRQIGAELVLERSGPDRYLSTFPLVAAFTATLSSSSAPEALRAAGRLTAQLWALRRASLGVAIAVEAGESPGVTAALVKDLGTQLEQEIVDVVRAVRVRNESAELERLLAEAVLSSPGFTLRGGTTEILRDIVSKGLGAR